MKNLMGDSNTIQGVRNSTVERNSDALFSSNENRAASYRDLLDFVDDAQAPLTSFQNVPLYK